MRWFGEAVCFFTEKATVDNKIEKNGIFYVSNKENRILHSFSTIFGYLFLLDL